jgi:hypothetical protein
MHREDVDAFNDAQSALDEIAYAANSMVRWAINVRTLRAYAPAGSGVGYLRLLTEEMDNINIAHKRLLDALEAASLQATNRDTKEKAA